MKTQKVGIREFRENLSTYVLETETPVAITRHGDTVGFYIPARRKRSEADKAALREAHNRLQEELLAKEITEDDILTDFKEWRRRSKDA